MRGQRAYRVENDQGLGPYSSGLAWAGDVPRELHPSDYYDPDRQPSPTSDRGLDLWFERFTPDRYRWRYGFLTLHQARHWFLPPEWRALRQHGFLLASYEVQELRAGFYQVVFLPLARRRAIPIPERFCCPTS